MDFNQADPQSAARTAGVCPATARKWFMRFAAEGRAGLQDRSSRPGRLYRPTRKTVVEKIIALRRLRLTGKHIARETGVSPATVSRVLKRAGLSRLRDLEPAQPVCRYERKHPGELIHIDIKKLGRFERPGHRVTGSRTGQSNARGRKQGYGWEYVHVCIDDNSRLSFTQIHTDEKAVSAVAHLKAAVAWYKRLGVTVARVMTDNGSCYKSHAFAKACKKTPHPAYPHQTLHAQNQRKGRALHPDRSQRMGLCARLSDLRTARRGTAPLDAHV